MFEEFYIYSGMIQVPTGEYDSMSGTSRQYTDYPVIYFSKDASYRDRDGVLQVQTYFMCKPAPGVELPEMIPANSRFIDKGGDIADIRTVERKNNFDMDLECFKLAVNNGRVPD
jgi:hypothetical protein